jgi:hypothetical protein
MKRLVKATTIFSKVSPVARRNKQPIIKAKSVAKMGIRRISSKSKFSDIIFFFR